MIRLFKHYIPHAVLLLGLIDVVLLVLAGEAAWRLRAAQIDISVGSAFDRAGILGGLSVVMLTVMIAVGVYGSESLRSMRFATARLLVAISLGVIALSFLDWLTGGAHYWRSVLGPTRWLLRSCS